jgi:hypothetical protein
VPPATSVLQQLVRRIRTEIHVAGSTSDHPYPPHTFTFRDLVYRQQRHLVGVAVLADPRIDLSRIRMPGLEFGNVRRAGNVLQQSSDA